MCWPTEKSLHILSRKDVVHKGNYFMYAFCLMSFFSVKLLPLWVLNALSSTALSANSSLQMLLCKLNSQLITKEKADSAQLFFILYSQAAILEAEFFMLLKIIYRQHNQMGDDIYIMMEYNIACTVYCDALTNKLLSSLCIAVLHYLSPWLCTIPAAHMIAFKMLDEIFFCCYIHAYEPTFWIFSTSDICMQLSWDRACT